MARPGTVSATACPVEIEKQKIDRFHRFCANGQSEDLEDRGKGVAGKPSPPGCECCHAGSQAVYARRCGWDTCRKSLIPVRGHDSTCGACWLPHGECRGRVRCVDMSTRTLTGRYVAAAKRSHHGVTGHGRRSASPETINDEGA